MQAIQARLLWILFIHEGRCLTAPGVQAPVAAMDVVADSIGFPDNGAFLRRGCHGCTNFCISSLTSNLVRHYRFLKLLGSIWLLFIMLS